MAKKGAGAKGPRRNPDEWERKPLVLQMRGSAEWKAWVERLAKFDRGSVADVTDRALAAYARLVGFTEKPPER